MHQVIASRCYYCGLPVNPQQDDFCPHCHYPVTPAKEEEYLTATLASLQQAMSYGGAQLKVVDLFQRYQNRLRMLQKLSAVSSANAPTNAPEVVAPTSVRVASVVYEINTPGKAEIAAPPVGVPEPRRIFSWRSFFADQAINIVASLGAFLILVGALSFVATTSNLLLAFFIVFIVHAVFGITGIITHRFASFRIVANIYTIIFALLVPLVGFSAYRLVAGNHLELSTPVLIAISALYAAIVYTMLALFQRYTPFAYLGMAALAVTDLATASALNLGLWWWPSMLMILALLSLVSIDRSPGIRRVFAGNRAILRQPVRIFMYVFVVMGTFAMVVVTLYSVFEDSFSQYHSTEAGYAILCLSLLRLLWSVGNFWLARRTRGVISLAFLFLVSVLAFCYALQFDATGYALALTIVALLYASISRFAVQLLQPFGTLELKLDWIALALVLLVPCIASPTLPWQLLAQVDNAHAAFQANWQTYAEAAAILAGLLLTLSIVFKRASFEANPSKSAWRWLLLFCAFLFVCAHSLVIVALHLNPVWSLLGASVAFMVVTILVRQRVGNAWADPLDISALFMILVTLGVSLQTTQEVMGRLLLFFSVATYAILLYQRRATWLFVPTIFATGALLLPINSFWTLVLLTPALAILGVIARRLVGNAWSAPFAVVALLSGIMAGYTGFTQQHLEATALALLIFAILACIIGIIEDNPLPIWITPFFATWSMIVSAGFLNDLFRPPIVAIVAAALGISISIYKRRTIASRQSWHMYFALPLYTTALLAALLTGVYGTLANINVPFYGAVPDALLVYALVAFSVVLLERRPAWLWLTAGFAAWGVALASQLTPPYVAGIGAGAAAIGIIAGRVIRISPERVKIPASLVHLRQFTWSWPWYAITLLVALFTCFWQQGNPAQATTIAYCMLGLTIVALAILLIERLPELLIFPVGFAAGTMRLWYPQLDFTSLMIAYSILCVLVFSTQFAWRVLPHTRGWLAASTLHETLGIVGQACVVIAILSWNGFSTQAGTLAQVGAGALLVLAALVFSYGLLRPRTVMLSLPSDVDDTARLRHISMAHEAQRWCYSIAGLLLSLVVCWELSAFGQTRLDVLLLAPASYLTIIAPFLMRNSVMRERRAVGQIAAVLGACLLLLPALWFSFNDINLVPTAILLGESLALLTLGVITRVRIFILSSAGLIIVGTLRALFLATPPSLTLMLTGITLLLIATVLILTRHKLQMVWKQWE